MGLGAAGFLLAPELTAISPQYAPEGNPLLHLSAELMGEWTAAILSLQVIDNSNSARYGGIASPDTGQVPGRCGDAIYPLFYMAAKTGNHRYADAAMLLYQWMESNVSDTDGAWLNEPQKNAWKGITVFTCTALCETIHHHGNMMEPAFKQQLLLRIRKAAQYIADHFTIDYGNINYPISATYALALAGQLLNEPTLIKKGSSLAQQAMQFISPADKLIFGEGQPYYERSAKGCLPVDLGYNVEESIPGLVQYGLLMKDEALLQAVTSSMQGHMNFMLPDGAWDNSWGTRNYKWTYWGSRTTDGCQAAYALLQQRDPRFYTVALRNLQLMKACTHNGLLHGGPHLDSHHITPNVHHTFCHMKGLANVLNNAAAIGKAPAGKALLPRDTVMGTRFFADIHTWLLALGSWRATVTGYDRNYKDFTNGHASGGALTMLWHEKTGPILVASMNSYQLYEKDNMPADNDLFSMPLTARLELIAGKMVFASCSDLQASITVTENKEQILVNVSGRLVNAAQQDPPGGPVPYRFTYICTKGQWKLLYHCGAGLQAGAVKMLLPLVCRSTERLTISGNTVQIKKPRGTVTVICNQPVLQLPSNSGRIFNHVPGMEAAPLTLHENAGEITITVS